ncbi:MAG: hypothetical protein A2X34_03415 [Elusimicrobia bacterium GWC2_51_8]|nr:MAG: hypothetical protein A2X33_07220 [Elusimicrobia bacterium GWA2_51_34]OGR59446.1 MAG: hypothetical protein A2X34_03415 [Elusimicrobia bacterium GWC2_51_8]OGR84772.1 MAG: hypothetical protein A2021_08430 [Elusimicrobia bacterium GWF2_52_66]HAF95310.1 hypothetical protein [Elusimicrobiota bacterium]HCE96918.1 hypothetical protein [Elusimicrobiota bacterium]
MKTQIKTLQLKPDGGKRIAGGHLWVFSNELVTVDKTIEPGSICGLLYPDGKPAGIGFFNPRSLIAMRLLKNGTLELNGDLVSDRLKAAMEYRKALGVERFCRLCYGESDGLPGLIIDRYGDYLVMEMLSAGTEKLKTEILDAAKQLLRPKAVLLKNTHPFRTLEGLELYEESVFGEMPETAVIEENGLKYKVRLSEGQKTGWYFDQRENRAAMAPYFKGRKVLDLYTYLGGFAVTASASGAQKIWAVDSSQSAVELAEENAALNGLEEKIVFKKEDAERILSAASRKELPEQPDFILLDPPNFVRSKKNLNQAAKLFIRLNTQALSALPEGGLLAVSSCSHHISREIFTGILAEAAAKAGRKTILLELRSQAKDHPILLNMPETEYLHFALLRVI